MHELQVTESILDIVVKHAKANQVNRVLSVQLKIGELSDLENEWIQRYFDYLSKGTLAEGATLKIERIPVVMQCNVCSHTYEVNMKEIKDILCPECGGKENTFISGREYYIKDMEVE
jgi:hydrogenase nickel incorporation protein HypA/HybF